MSDFEKKIKSKNEDIRAALAEDAAIPLHLLKELAHDPSIVVRQAVTNNPTVTPEILDFLLNDKEEDVVIYVAGSAFITYDLALKLAHHNSAVVRSCVASNEMTSQEVLTLLSDDDDIGVIEDLARNVNTPPNILKKLSMIDNSNILNSIANNDSCPPEILEKLSKSEFESIREAVANNINTPLSTLELLSIDTRDIRLRVAGNPSTPLIILENLSSDKDKYVKEAVKHNPSAAGLKISKSKNKTKQFNIDETAQSLLEEFNLDCDLIIETTIDSETILMLRSGAPSDEQYILTIERTEDHEDFEILYSYTIEVADREESILQFKSAIEVYLQKGGSRSSLEIF